MGIGLSKPVKGSPWAGVTVQMHVKGEGQHAHVAKK